MYAKKVLLAVVAALVLLVGAGVAYANSTQDTSTGGGRDNGAQVVAGQDDSDGPSESAEEPGDADEPGDVDGPGDTED